MADAHSIWTTPGPWSSGCRTAISLSFDDGLRSHLEVAIPVLDEYGLPGSFYINPPSTKDEATWRELLTPWGKATSCGHEIGNHSLTHPCTRNSQNLPMERKVLEDMTLDDIETDVLEAERRLNIGIPQQPTRSFCYPCYQSHVGIGTTCQSYVPVIARHFVAGRGGGGGTNDPRFCDLHCLWSVTVERMSGTQLIGLVESAALEGRWAILTFHGINEGHLPVAEYDLRALCGFLDSHRESIWTAPVATVADRVRQWRNATAVLAE